MSDCINFKEVLGMTDQQVLDEIRTMRVMEKVIKERVGDEAYYEICMETSRRRSEEFLRSLGASDEDIRECCDYAEESMRGEREHAEDQGDH